MMSKGDDYIFLPITIKDAAPGGACVLRSFEDVDAFVTTDVAPGHRVAPHWKAVRLSLMKIWFGDGHAAEAHEATRYALGVEGWLDS
jgi:hypothetical protein